MNNMSMETQILIIAVVVTVTFLSLMIGMYLLEKRRDRSMGPPR